MHPPRKKRERLSSVASLQPLWQARLDLLQSHLSGSQVFVGGLSFSFCHFGRTRCFRRGSDVMNWTAKGFFCLSELAFLYLFAFIRLLFFCIPQINVPLGMICMIQRDDCAVSRTGPFLDWTLPRIQSLPYLPTTPFAMHESRLLSSILPPSLFLISACARITSSS